MMEYYELTEGRYKGSSWVIYSEQGNFVMIKDNSYILIFPSDEEGNIISDKTVMEEENKDIMEVLNLFEIKLEKGELNENQGFK